MKREKGHRNPPTDLPDYHTYIVPAPGIPTVDVGPIIVESAKEMTTTPSPESFTRILDDCSTWNTQLWTYEEHAPISNGAQLVFTIPAGESGYIIKARSLQLFRHGMFRVILKPERHDPNVWWYVFLYSLRSEELQPGHNEVNVEFIGERPPNVCDIGSYMEGEKKFWVDQPLPVNVYDGNFHVLDIIYKNDFIAVFLDFQIVKAFKENISPPPMWLFFGCESKPGAPATDWTLLVAEVCVTALTEQTPTWEAKYFRREGDLESEVIDTVFDIWTARGELEMLNLTADTPHLELGIIKDGTVIYVPYANGTTCGPPRISEMRVSTGLAPLHPFAITVFDGVYDRYGLTLTRPIQFHHNLEIFVVQDSGVTKRVAVTGRVRYRRIF